MAAVFVVDSDGRILMQHRDGNAPAFPNQWQMVGGVIESGETPEDAAAREVREETGLTIEGHLVSFGKRTTPRYDPALGLAEWFLFGTATAASQDDVVCGEGSEMVFTTPEVAVGRDLTPRARAFFTEFLASDCYRVLAQSARRMREELHG